VSAPIDFASALPGTIEMGIKPKSGDAVVERKLQLIPAQVRKHPCSIGLCRSRVETNGLTRAVDRRVKPIVAKFHFRKAAIRLSADRDTRGIEPNSLDPVFVSKIHLIVAQSRMRSNLVIQRAIRLDADGFTGIGDRHFDIIEPQARLRPNSIRFRIHRIKAQDFGSEDDRAIIPSGFEREAEFAQRVAASLGSSFLRMESIIQQPR
jgi:hypothetical protein